MNISNKILLVVSFLNIRVEKLGKYNVTKYMMLKILINVVFKENMYFIIN